MTNAPETRKTHVTRIFGTNKSGDVLPDIWADVERIAVSKSRTQTAQGFSQGLQRKYLWRDDPNSDDYLAEDADNRDTQVLKVCRPDEENLDDPEEWIPIRVKKSIRASGGDGDGQKYQERLRNNNDEEDNTARIVEPRRIVHYDTNIDNDAQAAADAGATAYVISGEQYEKDLTSKDDGQYVEHEIIKFFKGRNSNNHVQDDDGGADVNSGLQVKLLNEYLIDESEPAKLEETGLSGINPPYRLDPYQNIINVKFRTLYLLVIVEGGNHSFNLFSAASAARSPSVFSKEKKNSVKLLDNTLLKDGNNSISGFGRCFSYVEGASERDAWLQSRGLLPPDFNDGAALYGADFAPTNQSCPWPGGGEVPFGLVVAPTAFTSSSSVAKAYLYSIPAGDGLVSVDIGGILPNYNSPGLLFGEIATSGSVTVSAKVYSTVKEKVKKLDQLMDLNSDGKQRPTQDDTSVLNLTSLNQGKFTVNVRLDKNKADVQTDNYGNLFQPYKVTFDPGKDAVDNIPSQPPPSLPKNS